MHDVFTWPVGRAADVDPRSEVPRAPFPPIAIYVIASAAGGAAIASLLGLIGLAIRGLLDISETALLVAGVPVALLAVACQLAGRVHPLPERRAQVPRRWVAWNRPVTTAAAFGLMIGAGALTYLQHATAWVLAVVLLAGPTWWIATTAGAIYGVVRGAPLMITWGIDRSQRRRPRWERVGVARAPAALALAPVALVIYLAALALSAAGA